MKHLKMLALAITAAICVIAFAGAGSANATVLCKTATNPCTSAYPKGTKFRATLKTGTITKFEAGAGNVECEGSEMEGEVTEAGGKGVTVTIPLGKWSFSLCKGTVTVIVKPKIIVHWKPIFRFSWTFKAVIEITLHLTGGVSCTYGSTTGEINVGESVGEPTSELTVESSLPKLAGGFLCASSAKWTGAYTLNEPTPLYAAES